MRFRKNLPVRGSAGDEPKAGVGALRPLPSDPAALQCLFDRCLASGQVDEARRLLDEAPNSPTAIGPLCAQLAGVLAARGDSDGAISMYRKALTFGFAPYQVLNNLAMALRDKNDLAAARQYLNQALCEAPQSSDLHSNLGDVLRLQGELEGAVTSYRQALVIRPNLAATAHNLGVSLQDLGRLDSAADAFRRAIEINPREAASYNGLGSVLQAQGSFATAMTHYLQAVKAEPAYPESYVNIGTVLVARGEIDQAIALFEHALTLRPTLRNAQLNLGKALAGAGRLGDAATALEHALATDPGDARTHVDLGAVLELLNRSDDAVARYRQALALQPDLPVAHSNLANALRTLGRLDEAAAEFGLAAALDSSVDNHVNQAMVELLAGRLVEGWRHCEWRWRYKSFELDTALAAVPRWQGEPLAGRRILLYSEQGYGDAIQFLRYVPMVRAAGGIVELRVQPPLRRLASTIGELETIQTADGPAFDLQCPLMSLPMVFGTDLSSIPSDTPYLSVPRAGVDKVTAFAWPSGGLRVGLVWAGDPRNRRDRFRSMPLASLGPLLGLPGVRYFSLQVGPAADELRSTAKLITDLAPLLDDFEDTAACIEQLDLVVSVDTASAHLAGALGKPVWILVARDPDFRWLLGRDDSPWYPSATLFRQVVPNDWAEPVDRATAALKALADTASARQ